MALGVSIFTGFYVGVEMAPAVLFWKLNIVNQNSPKLKVENLYVLKERFVKGRKICMIDTKSGK